MSREQNYILGNGERLTSRVSVPKGGGKKKPPYDFTSARKRIGRKLEETTKELFSIPKDASPDDKVVAVLTMHPRYISKSDTPGELLRSIGLEIVGSRSRLVKPDNWGIQKHPLDAIADDLFIAGTRSAFEDWNRAVTLWTEDVSAETAITHIEDIRAFSPEEKLREIPEDKEDALFEVVLHNMGDRRMVDAFLEYASVHGAEVMKKKLRDVRGLTFLPVMAKVKRIKELAQFTLVRVARGMPLLRVSPGGITRGAMNYFSVTLPMGQVRDVSRRAVIFDGGIPSSARSALSPWVNVIEPKGIGQPVPKEERHGLSVTSAFLFGPLQDSQNLSLPLCAVDHVRVIEQLKEEEKDIQAYDVLDRILAVLDGPEKYDFVNISLGPRLAVCDDEVNRWTAELDQRFSKDGSVVTIAAGNDGEKDSESGLNRIQPPADGVNILAVGAAVSSGVSWKRADYSCVGPGRRPGLVKPDGMSFGGSRDEPFMVLDPSSHLAFEDFGTSLAAPVALRGAASIAIQLGKSVNSLATRALLIHGAKRDGNAKKEVGWGLFESDPMKLITCDDDEALILYQGELPVGEHLRAPIPIPDNIVSGKVTLTATLVISPEVDPEHPGAYTRAGLEVVLRPHCDKFASGRNGKNPTHPKSKGFFSASNMYGSAEYSFRGDGHKWEPCIRNSRTLLAKSLKHPCFDIYYHQREAGARSSMPPQPIIYSLVVGVKVPRVQDFYNQVVRSMAGILVPIRPRIQLSV